MSVQTSYNYEISQGIAGGLYDIASYESNTRIAVEEISFGRGLVAGDRLGENVKLPTLNSKVEDFEGVAMNGFTTQQDLKGNVIVEKGQNIGVLYRGKIWVVVSDEANPVYKEKVYLITDGENKGCFTTEADAESTSKIPLNAEYIAGKNHGLAPQWH